VVLVYLFNPISNLLT